MGVSTNFSSYICHIRLLFMQNFLKFLVDILYRDNIVYWDRVDIFSHQISSLRRSLPGFPNHTKNLWIWLWFRRDIRIHRRSCGSAYWRPFTVLCSSNLSKFYAYSIWYRPWVVPFTNNNSYTYCLFTGTVSRGIWFLNKNSSPNPRIPILKPFRI